MRPNSTIEGGPSRVPLPSANIDLVLDSRGELVSMTSEAAAWVAHPAVLPALRDAVEDRGPGWWDLGPVCVRCVEMASASGVRFLVTAVPPARELTEAQAALTPTQLAVAEYAAAGATASEIGSAMGRSPETVRTHLKAVYQCLHVASRIELARLFHPPAIAWGS